MLKIDLYSGHLPRVLACFKVGCVAKDIPKAVQLINDDNILAHLNQQAILCILFQLLHQPTTMAQIKQYLVVLLINALESLQMCPGSPFK